MTQTVEQAAGQPARSELPEPLVTLLTSHLDVKVNPDQLSADTTFESLEMDSLSLMELVVAAEQELGIVLPDEAADLSPSSTLGDAARAFRNAT
ncbi:phosphopantetheine-binding protein [Streptomyces sp. NPDC048506]|uniref:acyl carrier protein n=1 Tax=Streptomyces sp. NPDC048506 TaxID=3155028 RepID=UPI003412CF5C